MSNTSRIGAISMSKFTTRCLEKGWTPSIPVGNYNRYDCILDRGNGLERIQVKTGKLICGSIVVKVSTSIYSWKGLPGVRRGYKNDVDYFGVFCSSTDRCYLIPIDDAPKNELSLRVDKPKNRQVMRIRWAKDYEI